ERLKDFNENIVESISVGVFAVDLEDRVEFWNSQMEVMYALPRWQAVGKRLSDIFPASFCEEFYRFRQAPGIHNLYKFRLGTAAGESRVTNIAIAPLVTRKFNVIGRLILVDDITERIELESQLSGGKNVLHWPAGRRRGARGQYPAGGDLVLRADACQAGAGRPQES